MFNAGYKKAALDEAERAIKVYQTTYDTTINRAGDLQAQKDEAYDLLKEINLLFSWIVDLPKEMEDVVKAVQTLLAAYELEKKNLKILMAHCKMKLQ